MPRMTAESTWMANRLAKLEPNQRGKLPVKPLLNLKDKLTANRQKNRRLNLILHRLGNLISIISNCLSNHLLK